LCLAPSSRLDSREQVLAAARARAAALVAADEDALSALLHPEFRWTSHTGEQLDRAGYVAANTGGRTRWRRQDLGAVDVVVVGNAAVLRTVVTDMVHTATGLQTHRMPMTQLWVSTDQGWQCLAGHAGPAQDER
jgi:hypothetical protein